MKHKDLKAEWGVCVGVFGGWGRRRGETVRGQENARKYESNTLKILFINKCLNKTEKTTLYRYLKCFFSYFLNLRIYLWCPGNRKWNRKIHNTIWWFCRVPQKDKTGSVLFNKTFLINILEKLKIILEKVFYKCKGIIYILFSIIKVWRADKQSTSSRGTKCSDLGMPNQSVVMN